jgi:hypothetical protein
VPILNKFRWWLARWLAPELFTQHANTVYSKDLAIQFLKQDLAKLKAQK